MSSNLTDTELSHLKQNAGITKIITDDLNPTDTELSHLKQNAGITTSDTGYE